MSPNTLYLTTNVHGSDIFLYRSGRGQKQGEMSYVLPNNRYLLCRHYITEMILGLWGPEITAALRAGGDKSGCIEPQGKAQQAKSLTVGKADTCGDNSQV